MRTRRWVTLLSVLALCGCGLTQAASSTPLPPPSAAAAPSDERAEPTAAAPSGQTEPAAEPLAVRGAYTIGSPTLSELYVAPTGNDSSSGASATTPLRTLTEAWRRIPTTTGATGYRINLLPGTYPCEPGEPDACFNYFSDRAGSYAAPIIIRATDGAGSATIRGGLNLARVSYLYLIDLALVGGGDLPVNSAGNNLLHLDAIDHMLLRGLSVLGPNCANDGCNNLQEVLKVNQAAYLYVEESELGGAWHSTVDYFAVQHGHFIGNRLHTAGQWCMYVKGGSAYLRVEGNELSRCQLGFQAGQAANLAVMRTPWLHYEAYDIKVVNNVLHDLPGVGLSVAGGYNILFAHNTLYRVAIDTSNGYALFQAVHGERNCTPTDELPSPGATCAALTALGAWGPASASDSQPAIPNRNIFIYNNLAYNPAPEQTLYAHLNLAGPLELPAGFVNLPSLVPADTNLVFAGNLIWNGPPEHPLGTDAACLPDNPSCNEERIRAANTINSAEPALASPECGDYRLAPSEAYPATSQPPDFPTWASFTPAVPTGDLTNTVAYDRLGTARGAGSPPGAYAATAAAHTCTALYLPSLAKS